MEQVKGHPDCAEMLVLCVLPRLSCTWRWWVVVGVPSSIVTRIGAQQYLLCVCLCFVAPRSVSIMAWISTFSWHALYSQSINSASICLIGHQLHVTT